MSDYDRPPVLLAEVSSYPSTRRNGGAGLGCTFTSLMLSLAFVLGTEHGPAGVLVACVAYFGLQLLFALLSLLWLSDDLGRDGRIDFWWYYLFGRDRAAKRYFDRSAPIATSTSRNCRTNDSPPAAYRSGPMAVIESSDEGELVRVRGTLQPAPRHRTTIRPLDVLIGHAWSFSG